MLDLVRSLPSGQWIQSITAEAKKGEVLLYNISLLFTYVCIRIYMYICVCMCTCVYNIYTLLCYFPDVWFVEPIPAVVVAAPIE